MKILPYSKLIKLYPFDKWNLLYDNYAVIKLFLKKLFARKMPLPQWSHRSSRQNQNLEGFGFKVVMEEDPELTSHEHSESTAMCRISSKTNKQTKKP